jgi:long-chain acyl-CoA synthetase
MTSQTAAAAVARSLACGNVARFELDHLDRFGPYKRLFYEDRSYTNFEELVLASRLARLLRDYGAGPGDRIVTIIPNSPPLTASFHAIWTIGAAAIPIMPQWTPAEVAHVLRNSEASILLTAPPLTPRIAKAREGIDTVKHVLVFGETDVPGTANILPKLDQYTSIEEPVDCSPSGIALLLYTSGTTAKPKGVMMTHGNVTAAFDYMSRLNQDPTRAPMLHMLPLTHVFGLLALNLANRWGFSSVLLSQFDPTRALQLIERHQVRYIPAVPAMLVYMLQHPERARFNTSSLRRVINGGAALPEAVRVSFERAFGCRVEQGYGLSETVAVATGYSEDMPYRAKSAGIPVPGVEIRILDDRGQVLPTGQVGEICLAGDHITKGYWQDPAATEAAFSGGWFHTGDIGYLDEDGFLFITDRKKDLIIKGGENIAPREIEEVLATHPAVAESAVVGIPDGVYGENICAVIQLKPGMAAAEEEFRQHVAKHVGKFKIPVKVVFQAALPRNSIGKVSKRDIRSQLAGGA